jgi:hypothetical protein
MGKDSPWGPGNPNSTCNLGCRWGHRRGRAPVFCLTRYSKLRRRPLSKLHAVTYHWHCPGRCSNSQSERPPTTTTFKSHSHKQTIGRQTNSSWNPVYITLSFLWETTDTEQTTVTLVKIQPTSWLQSTPSEVIDGWTLEEFFRFMDRIKGSICEDHLWAKTTLGAQVTQIAPTI